MYPLIRVLVIDDDAGVCMLFRRILADPEFSISETATLADARAHGGAHRRGPNAGRAASCAA